MACEAKRMSEAHIVAGLSSEVTLCTNSYGRGTFHVAGAKPRGHDAKTGRGTKDCELSHDSSEYRRNRQCGVQALSLMLVHYT